MNEGRDVWSAGNLSEKGKEVNKSLRRGLDIHKSMELFPKKVKPSEIDQTLEGLQEAHDFVEKERKLRRIGGPFAGSSLVEKAGTSEGAKLGWETRRGGGAAEEVPEGKGSGMGSFKKGDQIKSAKGLKVGDLLVNENKQFGTVNVARVTGFSSVTPESTFRATFVDPKDPSKPRMPDDQEFSIHDFELERDQYFKAEGKTAGVGEETHKKLSRVYREEKGHTSSDLEYLDVALEHAEKHPKGIVAGLKAEFSPGPRLDQMLAIVSENEKSIADMGTGQISKDQIEKILKDAGWDKLPIPDKAKEALEDLVGNGAKPVSEYTGKLMIEHGIAEEPPAFVRPKKLQVGDTVIPLDWRDVCLRGAKFDMPNVPPAAKVKKIYMGPAKVSKNAYPFGRMPGDISKVETVTEDRMWGLDLEGEKVGKDDDTFPSTIPTRDTTMVLRMEALASPEGEVNPGEMPPR